MKGYVVLTLLALAPTSALAADWPQLQGGPGHRGYSDEKLGTSFELLFRKDLGPTSPNVQPIISGGRVIVGTSRGEVLAFDASTGADLWKFSTKGAIRGSAASDGQRLFVASADRTLYALELATGKLLWQRRLLGPVRAAPVVDEGAVYLACQRGGLIKFAASDGSVLWRVDPEVPLFTTPAVDQGRVFFQYDNVLVALKGTP